MRMMIGGMAMFKSHHRNDGGSLSERGIQPRYASAIEYSLLFPAADIHCERPLPG
jgi:hypothetical protein